MGFILLLFYPEEWKDLYFENCSLQTLDAWNSNASSNHVSIGILYLTLGVIFEILYIPFLMAISSMEFMQYSCYKFMFFLGCIDMVALPANSIIAGIQAIMGVHYCAAPKFFYIVGCVAQICYLGASITCSLLAINRFFEILFPNIAKVLYSKAMMPFWYSISILYMISMLFHAPTFFSIVYLANYLDPFMGIERFAGSEVFYGSTIRYLLINSAIVILGCGVPYLTLCIVMAIKAKYYSMPQLSKFQRIMFLQSLAICIEFFIVATVYQWNQYFWVPEFMTKIENICWYCVHGDTPIVYLLLNETLRKRFFKMLKDHLAKSGQTMVYYATSIYPSRVRPHVQDFLTQQRTQFESREVTIVVPHNLD